MGTSRSGHEMGRKIVAVGIAIERSAPDAVNRAAFAAKQAQLSELDRVTTGRRLRGIAKGGKLGVRYDVKGTKNPTALVRATGYPWPFIERDTKPHTIAPRSSRGRKSATGATVLRLSSGAFVAGSVQHPGTKGKQPWAKGQVRAIPVVSVVLARRVQAIVAKMF